MFRIDGVVQAYDWGSTDGIPRVLGVEPTDEPQAEFWLGAHPKAPSTDPDGRPLDALVDERPELLGEPTRARFGDRLPFLLKVLSAGRSLSLQAHPSRAQAQEGYAREEAAGLDRSAPDRNYRDDWPKPEALVALTEFHALCGFREPMRTLALVHRLGVPALNDLVEPLADNDGLARVFLEILALADDERDLVAEVVEAARPHAEEPSELGLLCRTVVELDRDHPGDPGILAALLLNRVILQPGEAFFMPAGNLHAYLRGTGVEIMAASDNVLRGGLTSKHVDLDELARVLDFTPGLPEPVTAQDVAPGVRRYTVPAPEFDLFEISGDADVPGAEHGRIVLVVDGDATLEGSGHRLDLPRGTAAFVPAGIAAHVRGEARAFVAAPGA